MADRCRELVEVPPLNGLQPIRDAMQRRVRRGIVPDARGSALRVGPVTLEASAVAFPKTEIAYAALTWDDPEVEMRVLSLEDVVEQLAYDLLSDTHGGWENNDGAYGEFCFDASARSIHLEFNERFTSSELTTHGF